MEIKTSSLFQIGDQAAGFRVVGVTGMIGNIVFNAGLIKSGNKINMKIHAKGKLSTDEVEFIENELVSTYADTEMTKDYLIEKQFIHE